MSKAAMDMHCHSYHLSLFIFISLLSISNLFSTIKSFYPVTQPSSSITLSHSISLIKYMNHILPMLVVP